MGWGEVYKSRDLREWGKITNTKNSFLKVLCKSIAL